ncbi:PadR family transcriptional regulator [Halalkalicoccus salilacus]|uniref:PadR family transcriptional regulator n=1 Tax=Halalkalicoccus salilacus TaxID=3117459 RepID=UPI00300ECA1A
MNELTRIQRDLLYVIAGRDEPTVLTIKRTLEGYYDADVDHGRLYPNLDALSESGLVEKVEHGSRTPHYTLTDRGHREIEARHDWESQYVDFSEG